MLNSRDAGRRRVRWLMLVLLVAAAVATSVWLLWRDEGGVPSRASGKSQAHPSATAARCSPTNLAGVGGQRAAAAWRKVVEPVHQAACAHDFAALARLLGGGRPTNFLTEECTGCTSAEIVAMWREELGFDPAALARLLEVPPVVDQGGLTYERDDMTAVFARGTWQLPGNWSAFFVQCHEDDMCAGLAPSPSGVP
ncbi:hypothetical protein AB0C96_31815 [Streptomyces sp. NPDC048506]|uniref:hypothetical protein n=1 Tax=Streptomyces sp. NPDC048506 TaxID=3155028 RepID=UPI00341C5596